MTKGKPSQGHRVFNYNKNIYTRQKEIDLRVYHLYGAPKPVFAHAHVHSTIIAVHKTTRKARVS